MAGIERGTTVAQHMMVTSRGRRRVLSPGDRGKEGKEEVGWAGAERRKGSERESAHTGRNKFGGLINLVQPR
jgi:hypothetical protein